RRARVRSCRTSLRVGGLQQPLGNVIQPPKGDVYPGGPVGCFIAYLVRSFFEQGQVEFGGAPSRRQPTCPQLGGGGPIGLQKRAAGGTAEALKQRFAIVSYRARGIYVGGSVGVRERLLFFHQSRGRVIE